MRPPPPGSISTSDCGSGSLSVLQSWTRPLRKILTSRSYKNLSKLKNLHLMKVERQSFCLEERDPKRGFSDSMADTTILGDIVDR